VDAASQQPKQFFAESDMGAVEAGSDDKKHESKEKGQDEKPEEKAAGSEDKDSNQAAPASGPAFAKAFLDKYAGNYMPQPANSSDPKSWRDTFVKKYAGAYMHYIDAIDSLHEKFPNAPATAAKCHTLEQLKEWRAAANKQLEAYIPKEYQVFSKGAVDQQYKDNKARIEKEIAEAKAKAAEAKAKAAAAEANASTAHPDSSDSSEAADKPDADGDSGELAPVLFAATPAASPKDATAQDAGLPSTSDPKARRDAFVKKFAGAYGKYVNGSDHQVAMDKAAPANPQDCHTMDALKRWRDAQRSRMDTFVPTQYRTFGAGAVDQEYAENKARIEQEMAEAKATADEKDADSAKTEASQGDDAGAKAEHKDDDKKDAAAADSPKADADDKDTSAAVVEPSVVAAATVGSSSVPLTACFAIVASVAGVAFAVARPWASRQDVVLSEGLLTSQAPLAYVDVV